MASEWANRGAKRAPEARAELGHGDSPPPDVLDAVERAGAHVVLLELDPRVAGAYVPRVPLVVVNGRQPLVRQRFTLAHELGHHRMGHRSVVVDGPDVRLARWLGLEPREDGLAGATAALPRIPGALRATALGDYLAGATGADGLAGRLGAEPDAVGEMLSALCLDRLAPG